MKLVIIESPFAGDVKTHINYAKQCVKDSLFRGESPIASHLLYTQENILKDSILEERNLGINAGLAWQRVADLIAIYIDHGISEGMNSGINSAINSGVALEYRSLLSD